MYVYMYLYVYIYVYLSLKKGYESKTFVRAHLFEDPQNLLSLLHSLKYMCNNVYLGKGRGGIACARLKLPSGI